MPSYDLQGKKTNRESVVAADEATAAKEYADTHKLETGDRVYARKNRYRVAVNAGVRSVTLD